MSKPTVAPEDVKLRLDDAAMALTHTALAWLKSHPKGVPVVCTAVVMTATGDPHMLVVGHPSRRIEALTFMAKTVGDVVGFAMVFDGYVSEEALAADYQSQPRIDAIVSVVRTKWGLSSTGSVAYAYDAAGQLELRPERDKHVTHAEGTILDGYGVVFESPTVH